MKKLLIKFPTRSRPLKFFNTLLKYQKLRTTDNVHFLVTLDSDDKSMNSEQIQQQLSLWGNLTFIYGESNSKIAAVNRDVNEYNGDWDVLLLASDDMVPIEQGYDEIILNDMERLYPNGDGVLFYNDGYTSDTLNTLCIMGKKYYERDNYIYHPDYKSLWCDNEFMLVAEKRGKQTYIDRTIIKHEHPMNDRKVPMDASYRQTLAYYEQDKNTFEKRKEMNFGLTEIKAVAENPTVKRSHKKKVSA